MDGDRLKALGQYLMSLPYENYSTGVSGYKPSNKAAIVVKDGWIVGEYYNQAGANKALYYTASNGKTFAMLLAGHLAQTYSGLDLGLTSKLYDRRWLPQGFPLTDSRKAGITLRPGVPPRVGDHPGGRTIRSPRGGADRGGLGLRAVHGREGCRVAAERAARLHPGPSHRPTPRAARTRAWRSTT